MPHIDPDREAWELFKGLPRDRPIHMLNLITLKTRAEYPEGHPGHGKDISGADAYRAYGRGIAPVFERLGARQVWAGRPQVMVTGPGSEAWELAFIDMVRDPHYRTEVVPHRTAAVSDSRLLCLEPLESGGTLGE